jgi:hypothetical protein
MKKVLSVLLALLFVFSVCACGSSHSVGGSSPFAGGNTKNNTETTIKNNTETTTASNTGTVTTSSQEETPASVSEEEVIEDSAWDELESLGKIETENGLFYVTITMPAEFVGSDITQESIDANAGGMYTSGKLNDDGSVTYKMTKKQHKAMLDSIVQSIDEGLQEMVDSSDYAFTKITHNDDCTVFDAYLSTEEVGLAESFMVMGFYMYGGMYGLLFGHQADNIAVNYYSPSGNLISTANSSEMGG